jgi:hypothetical protein
MTRVTAILLLAVSMNLGAGDKLPSCPSGTSLQSRQYADGGKEYWCARPNGVSHGPTASFYVNGGLVSKGEYVDGESSGTRQYYFNNGAMWRRDVWREGMVITKWLNPKLANLSRSELERLGAAFDAVAVVDCTGRERRPKCAPVVEPPPLRISVRYRDGRRAQGDYSNGLRNGEWTFWYPSARMARRASYVAGNLNGRFAEWSRDGSQIAEGEYLSGERTGRWRIWDGSGHIRERSYSQ